MSEDDQKQGTWHRSPALGGAFVFKPDVGAALLPLPLGRFSRRDAAEASLEVLDIDIGGGSAEPVVKVPAVLRLLEAEPKSVPPAARRLQALFKRPQDQSSAGSGSGLERRV